MGDYNAALGNAGGPVPLVVGGKEYPLAYLDQGAKAKFETWHERTALQAVQRGKADLDPESYALLLKITRDEIRGRAYRWGGTLWLDAVRSDDGLAMLLWLALLPHNKGVTLDDARRLRDEAYEEDPGDADDAGNLTRQPEIVNVLLDLAYAGKVKVPARAAATPAP